jgi:hypothetical protein
MSVRITCINKDNGNHTNPHEAITHYGWVNEDTDKRGRNDRPSMVKWVEEGGTAYVKDAIGNVASCHVRTSSHGTKFLQTRADDKCTDNLLSLPECP